MAHDDPAIATAERHASDRDCVVGRSELAELGIGRLDVAREVRRGRWTTLGLHSVAVHRGPLSESGAWRAAINEVGSHAALDGVSALRAAGMTGYTQAICISVPHGWQPRRIPNVTVKELRNWNESDVIEADLRRIRPELAAVRAASWAQTDRQAALILIMSVHQGVARAADLARAAAGFRRLRRRAVIEGVIADVGDGVRALGELDFARECRRRGLPEPTRQVIRRGPRGRVYLDVYFEEFHLVVEVEGAHHDDPLNAIDDALRQNHLSAQDTVLRIPVAGFRVEREAFMAQVEQTLRDRGWHPKQSG
jgi:very-short-patch-repair endonuclease